MDKTHDSSGLEDLEDLTIDTLPSRCVASSFDGIDGIERVLSKLFGELHEITLDELDLILETQILGVLGRTTDLESVVVQTDNVDVGEAGDLACWTTDTTSDVQNAHAGLETHLRGEVVFVTGETSGEGFALVEPTKVERLGPGELIEFSSPIVIAYTSRRKISGQHVCGWELDGGMTDR